MSSTRNNFTIYKRETQSARGAEAQEHRMLNIKSAALYVVRMYWKKPSSQTDQHNTVGYIIVGSRWLTLLVKNDQNTT